MTIARLVKPDDTVLEVGGQYGTTSCALANATRNSGRVLTVEPDRGVWGALLWNRLVHRCNFWLYRGVISERDVSMDGLGYGTRAVAAADGKQGGGGGGPEVGHPAADVRGCPRGDWLRGVHRAGAFLCAGASRLVGEQLAGPARSSAQPLQPRCCSMSTIS